MNKRILYLFTVLLAISACQPKEEEEPQPAPEPQDTTQAPVDSLTEDNMLLGNPSNAITSLATPNNYLLVKDQYALSYSNTDGIAKWVAWHLSTGWVGTKPRCDCFSPDYTLPAQFYQVNTTHYSNSGFDRGHMVPSADRNKTSADNAATFLMTNIAPQAPALNQGQWGDMETYCRTLMNAGHELYIYTGGSGVGGTGSQGGTTVTIGSGHVTVPSHYWKVAIVLETGSDDLNRVDVNTRVITVYIPNTQAANAQPWGDYRISVDALEAITGYDFLSNVSTTVQAAIEANADTGPTQ